MSRKIKKFDIVLFLIPFIMFLIALFIYYPGILSFDSYNQLEQIRTGVYSNGHPFIHTLIEMGCLKIFNSPFLCIDRNKLHIRDIKTLILGFIAPVEIIFIIWI